MNKTNLPKKKSNSNAGISFADDKNQAFKIIKNYLINKHNEQQKRPHFRDAEIRPIDLIIKKEAQKNARSASIKTPIKTPIEKEIKPSIQIPETPKIDDASKRNTQRGETTAFTVLKNSNNKVDFVKGMVNHGESSSYLDTKEKDLDNYYQHVPSIYPRPGKKSDPVSDIESKPRFYFNYRQCGFKYDEITSPKYGNYFKVNVGAPRNWLKSKFQNNYKFTNESYMVAN